MIDKMGIKEMFQLSIFGNPYKRGLTELTGLIKLNKEFLISFLNTNYFRNLII